MSAKDSGVRKALLNDRAMHRYIRAIARARGVPFQDVDDMLGTVIAEAMVAPDLPLDDPEQTRKFLGAVTRRRCVDEARRRKRARKRSDEIVDDEREDSAAPKADDVLMLERVIEYMYATFPAKHVEWVRAYLAAGETAEEIAQREKVAAGYVRARISKIRAAVAKVTATVVAVIAGLFFGPSVRLPQPTPDTTQWSSIAPKPRTVAPRPPQAYPLRLKAWKECRFENWSECLGYFEQADTIDPAGASPEEKAMQDDAIARRQGEGGLYAKPPLP